MTLDGVDDQLALLGNIRNRMAVPKESKGL
jgi:hypothetical protein